MNIFVDEEERRHLTAQSPDESCEARLDVRTARKRILLKNRRALPLVLEEVENRCEAGARLLAESPSRRYDLEVLRARVQNWGALNWSYLASTLISRSAPDEYLALMRASGPRDISVDQQLETLRSRVTAEIEFLEQLGEQLLEGKESVA